MSRAPVIRWPHLLGGLMLLVLAWSLTLAGGCRKETPAAAADDAAERTRKAELLGQRAGGTAIPEKYDLLRRLIALYDDTRRGQAAYLELVVTLTRDRPPQFAEALRVARSFSDRHPADKDVGECFLQVADVAYKKDEATRTAALDEWSKHIEEHDVAGDVPKAQLYVDMVKLRLRQERWKDAEVAIETALAEPGVSNVDRIELLVRKGSLLAEKLGNKDGGKAAFRKALDLSREIPASEVGRIPPEQIEGEIKKIDGG